MFIDETMIKSECKKAHSKFMDDKFASPNWNRLVTFVGHKECEN